MVKILLLFKVYEINSSRCLLIFLNDISYLYSYSRELANKERWLETQKANRYLHVFINAIGDINRRLTSCVNLFNRNLKYQQIKKKEKELNLNELINNLF